MAGRTINNNRFDVLVDLSLYKDESQIEKKTPLKRKAAAILKKDKPEKNDDEDEEDESDEDYQPVKKKGNTPRGRKPKAEISATKKTVSIQ